MATLRIYTDGGCSGNQSDTNIGGWGAILEYGRHQKELYGSEANTTNNRMEMTALLSALNALKKDGQQIEVFSDSSYLMDCFRQGWYKAWQKNGWMTSGKKPVENKDLWEKLLAQTARHSIRFYRVKGHVNLSSKTLKLDPLYEKFKEWNGTAFTLDEFKYITEMNNRADKLANIGIDELREELASHAEEIPF